MRLELTLYLIIVFYETNLFDMKSLYLFFSLIFLSTASYCQNSQSQFIDMLDGRFDASNYLSENAYGFLPVPIIITDPAVEGGLGMMGLFFHETEAEKEKRLAAMKKADSGAARHLLPPSVSVGAVAATGNKSWFAGGGHMGFFKQGSIRYLGGAGYGDVNLDFFGSGDTKLPRSIELNTKASGIFQTLKFKLASSNFFLGASQRYVNAQITPRFNGDLNNVLPPKFVDAVKELFPANITTSAFGINLEFDNRDNVFSPTQGYQYSLEQLWYRESFGSDIDYELVSFKGLNYWPLSQHWRAGLRLNSEYADSENILPPFATPSIKLRGIPAMRYQGNFVGVAETELSWLMDSRWSVVGFIGAGRASNSSRTFTDASTQTTQGLGFRYHIARRYGFDMGIDIARGPDDTIWYITAGSAWGR